MKTFSPQSWKNFNSASCYSYALNRYETRFLRVGDYIQSPCGKTCSNEQFLATLQKELLEVFAFHSKIVESVEYPLADKQEMLYIHRNMDTGSYHFFRRDRADETGSDQHWSHKYPGSIPEDRYPNGEPITDPENLLENFRCWCIVLTPV